MRKWSHCEPDENMQPRIVITTEEWIMKHYWPYWEAQMIKKYGENYRDHFAEDKDFHEMAIEDFIISHWAKEIKTP